VTTARDIARALPGSIPNGDGWLCRCPVPGHGRGRGDRSPSLSVRDRDDGGILVHCFALCDWQLVLNELRKLGLRDDCKRGYVPARPLPIEPNPIALKIWHECVAIENTPAELYLRARGVTIPLSSSLRYHRGLPYCDGGSIGMSAVVLPCMVAAVHAPGGGLVAVHRTFLNPQQPMKAKVSRPKKGIGRYHRGAVRLGESSSIVGLAEGIEDALSATQLTGLTCWAAVGGGRLANVVLPAEVKEVHLFADDDDTGRRCAERASDVYTAQGRRVILHYPPEGLKDWNDVLQRAA